MSDRKLLVLIGLVAALVAGLAVFWQPAPRALPLPRAELPAGGDFTLRSADGPVSLKDYRGKLVLLYFGYTYCPDICPTALATIADALRRLKPEEQARVAAIFVSVDPARDTPARLKDYVRFFYPGMVGLTGTPAELADIARRYGAFYAKQAVKTAGEGYVVDHSSDTYVIGPEGRLLGKIAHGSTPDQVAAEIRQRLYSPQGV